MRGFCFWSTAITIMAMTVSAPPAKALTHTVMWSFRFSSYGEPQGRLFQAKSGSLFGAGSGYASGNGQIFRLFQSGGSWRKATLLSFDIAHGKYPYAGLIRDSSGAFYGTTLNGGTGSQGTVFKLAYSGGVWTESVLYNFKGGSDGGMPTCDLVMDPSTGALYGTTTSGGANDAGTVFDLTYSGGVWTENILHSFSYGTDGTYPFAGLLRDKSGALYGTTIYGGTNGLGTVFRLTLSHGAWTETILHSFGSGSDGSYPYAGLIEDKSGRLYGETSGGGVVNANCAYGCGTVFRLAPDGTETVLYDFVGGSDGVAADGGLYRGAAGDLYGTTLGGGGTGCGGTGCGTVFKLIKASGIWQESVLYSFAGGGDGQVPTAAVIEDSAGNLFGTTAYGGAYGYGTVFEISP